MPKARTTSSERTLTQPVVLTPGSLSVIVGVHRLSDETLRLHEYSPGFEPNRFAAHEKFFVEEVHGWVRARFGLGMAAEQTAVFGVSAGGELALALGLATQMSTARSFAPRLAAVTSRLP